MDITILSFDHPLVQTLLNNIGNHIQSKNNVSYDCSFSDEKEFGNECIISINFRNGENLLIRCRYHIADKILNHIYDILDAYVYVNPEILFEKEHITISKGSSKKFIYYNEIDHLSQYNNYITIGLRNEMKIQMDIWAPGIRNMYFKRLQEYYRRKCFAQ